MGIYVDIYKNGSDCTNGGESSYVDGFCITEIDGPFKPNDRYPRAKILKRVMPFGVSLKLVPVSKLDKCTMMGGNYASTTDSRFGEYCRDLMGEDLGNVFGLGPIAIHDRVEW